MVVFLGLVLAVVVLSLGIPLAHPPFGAYQWYGAAAGAIGSVAMAAFYRAMAAGPMSLVAPLSATSAAVPVVWSIVRGGQVGVPQAAGIVLAFVGVILASGPELRPGSAVSRSTLVYTLISATGFGLYYIFFALGSATSVYGTLLSQRVSGLLVLAPVALYGIRAGRRSGSGLAISPSALGMLAYIALGDVVANALYGVATQRAGRNLLKERLRVVQNIGILAALTGVLLLNT
jgi:uncharacterized membrane protein